MSLLIAAHEWVGRSLAIEGTIALGFGIAAFTFFGLAWRQVVRPIHGWVENINEVVNRELRVNGGSSIKDAIDLLRIQETVAHQDRIRLQQTLDDHIENADVHHYLQDGSA
jgi:hypothetical protein